MSVAITVTECPRRPCDEAEVGDEHVATDLEVVVVVRL
jgi:hypothetical protein